VKVFVIYDNSGTIKATATSALDGFDVGAPPDMYVHTFEKALDPKNSQAYLNDLHAHYRISRPGTPVLTPKHKQDDDEKERGKHHV
jgi:hypothetical protein